MNRRGFTLLETLVVISIIGMMVALLLPAVQHCRESARRAQCTNNLSQLMMAIHNYEHAHRYYPAGVINPKGPIEYRPVGYHHNWIVQTLPFMEESIAWRNIDFQKGVYHKNNSRVAALKIPVLKCSSGPAPIGKFGPISHYAAVHHATNAPIDANNNGVFYLNSRVRFKDVMDGVSHTLFLGEKLYQDYDLGWMSGTHATLRNLGRSPSRTEDYSAAWNGGSGDMSYDQFPGMSNDELIVDESIGKSGRVKPESKFGSFHHDGCQFAFGDGRVEFLHRFIDLKVLQSLAHRSDGSLIQYQISVTSHP